MSHVHKRYSKTEEGEYIIDISIAKYMELFDEWDNTASYVKKDLDFDLVEFLYECFEEVKKGLFVIRIKVPRKNIKKQKKVKESMRRYFEYMAEKKMIELKNHFKRTFNFLIMGLLFILLSVFARSISNPENLLQEVLVEGLTIMGWVTLWSVATGIMYEWNEIYSDVKIYRRISTSRIIFQCDY